MVESGCKATEAAPTSHTRPPHMWPISCFLLSHPEGRDCQSHFGVMSGDPERRKGPSEISQVVRGRADEQRDRDQANAQGRGASPPTLWADPALGRSGTHAEDEEKLDEHGTEGQDPGHENAAAQGEG